MKDLIALARARPGQLNYAASGTGSSPHLAVELFKSMAGVDIVRINYRGMGAAYTDVMAGQVHVTFGVAPGVMPYVKSGRLRGIAVTSAQPSPLAPGLVPVAASGLRLRLHVPSAFSRRLKRHSSYRRLHDAIGRC